jgi:hypothetical protein
MTSVLLTRSNLNSARRAARSSATSIASAMRLERGGPNRGPMIRSEAKWVARMRPMTGSASGKAMHRGVHAGFAPAGAADAGVVLFRACHYPPSRHLLARILQEHPHADRGPGSP